MEPEEEQLDDQEMAEGSTLYKHKPVFKLKDSTFRNDEETQGGLVKARNEVVSHRLKKVGSKPHVNCRVQTFGFIMGDLSDLKMKWVKEMGMGDLVYLQGKSLPRSLCYWLMSRVDPLRRVFIASSGVEYPFHKNQVNWVLGLPLGSKKVPTCATDDRMHYVVEEVYSKYFVVTNRNSCYLCMQKIMNAVERECVEEDEYDFKLAFLALALADVLCPTTCLRLAADLVPALSVVMEAAKYDWSLLVLDKLMLSCRRFALNFYRDGYAKGCGGCTYFLAIFYLDRLNRIPDQWGVFPRIKAWGDDEINMAKKEDKLESTPGSDYGRMEVAKRVLAGIGDGPREEVEDQVLATTLGLKRKVRRKGPGDNSNPFLRKLAKRARDKQKECLKNIDAGKGVGAEGYFSLHDEFPNISDEGYVSEGHVNEVVMSFRNSTFVQATSLGGSFVPSSSPGSRYAWGIEESGKGGGGTERSEAAGLDVGGWTQDTLVGCQLFPPELSVKEKETMNEKESEVCVESDAASPDVSSVSGVDLGSDVGLGEDGVVEGQNSGVGAKADDVRRPCKLSRSRRRRGTKPSEKVSNKDFVVDLCPRGSKMLKSRVLKVVRSLGAVLERELILCLSERSQEDVLLLKCDEYSATLSSCLSVLCPTTKCLDANYVCASGALYTKIWKRRYGDHSVRVMLNPNFSIFVPVMEASWWWCAAFCVNMDEIWVIDSTESSPIHAHDVFINKLSFGIDLLLHEVDSTWAIGRSESWVRKPLTMEVNEQGSGVRMLIAIKACADRYTSEMQANLSLDEECGWLLMEDLMDDSNEVKANVKQLLDELRI